MAEQTGVYLITGFLGSGKTTFLNRIINRFPKEKKLTILVNEFGEIGVDGTLVEGEDIDMMEISKGSIFCVCVKTDFIKGLYELNTTVKPDILLIESTGVANPSDLKKDIKLPIFDDRFQFKEQFCVIDAAHFLDAYEVYASLEKQIASSSVFIINKTDIAPPETIAKIKEVVRRFHPEPSFFETTYADLPLERFFDFTMSSATEAVEAESATETKAPLSADQLEQFLDDLLDDPDLEVTPPDLLMSVALQWKGGLADQIRELADQLPREVVRAKGFVQIDDRLQIFNYVMGDWTLEPSDIPRERIEHINVIVIIGPPDAIASIQELTANETWVNLGTYQPYTQQ